MAITDRDKILQRKLAAMERNQTTNSSIPVPQDILDRKTYGMTPSMPGVPRPTRMEFGGVPDFNPVKDVIESNNARIPAPGYQPSVPIDREPPKQVLQSQPESKEVTSYKTPKPKKSIYESLRERRAQKQPAKKETPKPSVNRAIKPMQARQAGSSMRSLALQNMKRDKQATDVAQAKTDAIQAEIAKLRRK